MINPRQTSAQGCRIRHQLYLGSGTARRVPAQAGNDLVLKAPVVHLGNGLQPPVKLWGKVLDGDGRHSENSNSQLKWKYRQESMRGQHTIGYHANSRERPPRPRESDRSPTPTCWQWPSSAGRSSPSTPASRGMPSPSQATNACVSLTRRLAPRHCERSASAAVGRIVCVSAGRASRCNRVPWPRKCDAPRHA